MIIVSSIIIVQYADPKSTVCSLISKISGWSKCPSRHFCKEYSKGSCTRGDQCTRRHWCMLCHEEHPMGSEECSLFRKRIREWNNPLSFCLTLNAAGACMTDKCRNQHKCLFCEGKDHGSADCTHALERLINSDEHEGELRDA
jgi:hypothetical protein